MTLPIQIAIVAAGFYLALRLSPRGAVITGIVVGLALGWVEAVSADPDGSEMMVIGFVSRVLGGVVVYPLANLVEGVVALVMTVAIGALVLLAGGPIEILVTILN